MTQTLHGSLWGGRRWRGEDKEGACRNTERRLVKTLCLVCTFKTQAEDWHCMVAENGGQRTWRGVFQIMFWNAGMQHGRPLRLSIDEDYCWLRKPNMKNIRETHKYLNDMLHLIHFISAWHVYCFVIVNFSWLIIYHIEFFFFSFFSLSFFINTSIACFQSVRAHMERITNKQFDTVDDTIILAQILKDSML